MILLLVLAFLVGIVVGGLGVFMYGALVYAKNMKKDMDKLQ